MDHDEMSKVLRAVTWKKFRRYESGAEYYEMSQSKFEKLAKEADAIYKVDKVVLINCDIFEKYLEMFHVRCR